MHRLKATLPIILFSLAISSLSSASNYYVTQSGAGTRDGKSLANAWSASDFNSSSNWSSVEDADKIDPGDTVNLSGTITSSLTVQGSGTVGNLITIDGTNATLSATFKAGSKDYWQLTNAGWSSGMSSLGVDIDNSDNWKLSNLKGSANASAGFIDVSGGRGGLIDNVTYDGWCGGTGVMIRQYWSGSQLEHTRNLTVQNSYFRTKAGACGDVQTDMLKTEGSNGIIVQGNYFESRTTGTSPYNYSHNDIIQVYEKGGTSGGGPYNWTIRYNKFVMNTPETNHRSIFMFEDMEAGFVKIYGNMFVGLQGAGNGVSITRQHSSNYVLYFYNNTMVRKANLGNFIDFYDTLESANRYVKNNIFYDPGDAIDVFDGHPSTSVTTATNIYYDSRLNAYLGTSCSNFSDPTDECDLDPLFSDYAANDFTLQVNSPGIDAGTDLGPDYSKAIAYGATWPNPDLVTRNGAWDIGAYEYDGEVVVDDDPPAPPTGLFVLGVE